MSKAGCWDGRGLLAALEAAATWLEDHRASVDALNVFPVPDGDTGTNMSMTLNAAIREARNGAEGEDEVGPVAERAAYGALMGARGNSGVILSQLLRGFARVLRGQSQLGPDELAAALTAAAETAGRAVMKPVEGTILTVATAAAGAATAAAGRAEDLAGVLEAALAEARAAVARTPEQLPILKQAGVVDAGAQGYALILDGFLRHSRGLPTRVEETAAPAAPPAAQIVHVAHTTDEYGYCTEFVVTGSSLDIDAIRAGIDALGTSTLVVGEEGIVRVHVHTDDPGRVLSYVTPLGPLHKIKIDNMQAQHDRFVEHGEVASDRVTGDTVAAPLPILSTGAPPGLVGVVAVAPGAGLVEIFRSFGADAVVRGGQTMNPSTEELLSAIDGLPQPDVALLPNNGNVLLAAAQARDLSRKRVEIIPARTVPQGIGALVVYSPEADLATNATAMAEAAAAVRTGEVTIAVRDASIDEVTVRAGEALGLLDDHAVVAGPDRETVSLELIERMGAAGGEVLTVYYGADVAEDQAQGLAAAVRERFDGLDVEVVSGGQPHYPYIMSVE